MIALHYTFYKVGCITKWSYWSDTSTPFCSDGQQYRWNDYFSRMTTADCFRMMEDLYTSFGYFRYEDIRKLTGCVKPCRYLRYSVSFALPSTISLEDLSKADSPHFVFSVLVSSRLACIKYISLGVKLHLLNKSCFHDGPKWLQNKTWQNGKNTGRC